MFVFILSLFSLILFLKIFVILCINFWFYFSFEYLNIFKKILNINEIEVFKNIK